MVYQDIGKITIGQRGVLALSFALVIAYIVGSTIYTLYIHPLSKYPGPFWARVSTIPSWWHTRKQKKHLWLLGLQEKYGTAVRYRPDSVCINTPTAFREIYGPRGNVKKADNYRVWHRTVDAQNTWSTTSIERHARKRRVLNNAFSDAALRGAEPFLHSNTDRWLDLLGQQKPSNQEWTNSVNMADQITYLVFDVLGDLCYGTCFDMKEPGNKLRGVVEMMVEYVSLLYPILWSPISPLWIWLKPRGLDRAVAFATPAKARAWDKFVSDCQASRAKRQCDPESKLGCRKDFYHWLWEAKDPVTGKGYSLGELNAECELLTIAGSDTTATVLSGLIFYICRNPKVQERLAKELSETFSSYDDIKAGGKLQSCRYLTAVIQEGMRMAPPVAADLPREVLPGGTTIENHYIPQGMLVGTSSWAMHYNPKHYPDPYKFQPERWILSEAGATEASVATAESAFFAFSFGSRNCVGKNMAWLEMRLVLAKALWRYEIKPDPNNSLGAGNSGEEWGRQCEGQYQTYDIFVADRKGPMILLKKRSHTLR